MKAAVFTVFWMGAGFAIASDMPEIPAKADEQTKAEPSKKAKAPKLTAAQMKAAKIRAAQEKIYQAQHEAERKIRMKLQEALHKQMEAEFERGYNPAPELVEKAKPKLTTLPKQLDTEDFKDAFPLDELTRVFCTPGNPVDKMNAAQIKFINRKDVPYGLLQQYALDMNPSYKPRTCERPTAEEFQKLFPKSEIIRLGAGGSIIDKMNSEQRRWLDKDHGTGRNDYQKLKAYIDYIHRQGQ